MIEGLYVTISPDGKIEKYLSTRDGEVPFPDVSISDELIEFAEQNYLFLFHCRSNLLRLIDRSASDAEVIAEAAATCEEIKQRNILCGTLAYYEFLDYYHYWAPPQGYRRSRIEDSAQYFGRAAIAWQVVIDALEQLSQKSHPDFRHRGALYFTIKPFGKSAKILFRSEEFFYYFLLQHLLESKIRICKCQFCGRYFAPRTKHKTLYCDRVVRDGKTCKEIAPYLKRKERIAANKVLSLFEQAKGTMYQRFYRADDDKGQSVVDMTYDQYNDWLDAATKVRDRYLAGELTEEEAMAIIYVPTKDELLEQISSDLTLETAAT